MTLSQADQLGGSEIAQLEGMQVASEEGMRVTDHLSMLTDFTTGGLYDDSTVYVLDQQIFGITNNSPICRRRARSRSRCGLRRTAITSTTTFPMVSGFFQIRNATGEESLPQEALIINRNTFDYNFNTAMNPVLHLGDAWIAFNTGLQFTIAPRQLEAPQYENQNLFRQFVYANSSSFGNWLSFNASLYHEAGPFTATGYKLNSNDVGTTLQFTVGRPWGKTALITGYTRRDLTFSPLVRQFFTTSTYAGLQRKFLDKNLRPAFWPSTSARSACRTHCGPRRMLCVRSGPSSTTSNPSWSVDGQFAYEGGEVFSGVRQHVQQFLHHLCKTTTPVLQR